LRLSAPFTRMSLRSAEATLLPGLVTFSPVDLLTVNLFHLKKGSMLPASNDNFIELAAGKGAIQGLAKSASAFLHSRYSPRTGLPAALSTHFARVLVQVTCRTKVSAWRLEMRPFQCNVFKFRKAPTSNQHDGLGSMQATLNKSHENPIMSILVLPQL